MNHESVRDDPYCVTVYYQITADKQDITASKLAISKNQLWNMDELALSTALYEIILSLQPT